MVLVIVAMAATLASGFTTPLLSPLLLRVNPGAVVARMNKASSSAATATAITSPGKDSDSDKSATVSRPTLDFSHDEDLMRYKHELLSTVYERSLARGFD